MTRAEHEREVAAVKASLALADSRADRRDGPRRPRPPVKPNRHYTIPRITPL